MEQTKGKFVFYIDISVQYIVKIVLADDQKRR